MINKMFLKKDRNFQLFNYQTKLFSSFLDLNLRYSIPKTISLKTLVQSSYGTINYLNKNLKKMKYFSHLIF